MSLLRSGRAPVSHRLSATARRNDDDQPGAIPIVGTGATAPSALTLAIALVLANSAGAAADPTAGPSDAVSGESNTLAEIQVTGIRKSLVDALNAKRSSSEIVDAIAAEDIGKFPEQNLAESLQRITGVQIQRTSGEGQYVSIRGLDPKFALVQLDGRELPAVPSISGTRPFDYGILAAEFVNSVEVFKTPSADLAEGGLSGTVNVRSVDPDTLKGRQFTVVAKGVDDLGSGKRDPHLTALYTDKLLDGHLGVMVGVDYYKSHYQFDDYLAYGMEPYVGATGSGTNGLVQNWNRGGDQTTPYLFDNAQSLGQYQGERLRDTYVGGLTFRVNDSLEFYTQAFYAMKHNDYQWYYEQPRYTNPNAANSVLSTVLASSPPNLLKTVSETNVDYRNNWRPDYLRTSLSNYAGGVNFDLDQFKFNVDVYTADAKQKETNFSFDPIARASVTSTISGGPAVVTFNPGFDPLNPANYVGIGADGAIAQPSEDKISAISLKGSYEFGNDWLTRLEFGGRFSRNEDSTQPNSLLVSAKTLAGLLGAAYDPTVEGGSFSAAPYLMQRTFSFFGSSITALGSNTGALLAKVPLSTLLASTPITQNLAGSYDILEKDASGFLRVDFQAPGLPLKGNVGVRFVSTRQTSNGYSPDLTKIQYDNQGSTTIIPTTTAVSVMHDYTNVLPSLNLTYTISPTLIARFAAAKTMTRPDLSSIAPNTTVNAGTQSISRGNPDLQPFTAVQLDGSIEWYFSDASLLSLAVFNKDVKNFIQNSTTTEVLNVQRVQGGGTVAIPFSVFEPVNSSTSTTLRGFEAGYQQAFTFLPAPLDGLGTLLNYSHITAGSIVVTTGSAPVPLSGLSKENYNATLYFEKPIFGVRVAYNYRGGYVVDPASYFGDGDYRKAYGQLDASATLHATQSLDVTAEALNITDRAISNVDKYGISRGYEKFGTTVMVGVHYKFN
ncbi:MAG: TonB-dependent receptor [Pseudomonadota bacterium]|nr:TonB-dependent receptor [Pseudomonadota bacterium]